MCPVWRGKSKEGPDRDIIRIQRRPVPQNTRKDLVNLIFERSWPFETLIVLRSQVYAFKASFAAWKGTFLSEKNLKEGPDSRQGHSTDTEHTNFPKHLK